MRPLVLAVFLALAAPASAGTLAAESIICDNRDDLALLDRPNLRGQPAAEVFKRARASAELADGFLRILDIQAGQRHGAIEESRIVDERRRREADKAAFASFLANCAKTDAAQGAEVLERMAIGGVVRVRATVDGRRADVWTRAAGVSD